MHRAPHLNFLLLLLLQYAIISCIVIARQHITARGPPGLQTLPDITAAECKQGQGSRQQKQTR
jgi:hypothetical protein